MWSKWAHIQHQKSIFKLRYSPVVFVLPFLWPCRHNNYFVLQLKSLWYTKCSRKKSIYHKVIPLGNRHFWDTLSVSQPILLSSLPEFHPNLFQILLSRDGVEYSLLHRLSVFWQHRQKCATLKYHASKIKNLNRVLNKLPIRWVGLRSATLHRR